VAEQQRYRLVTRSDFDGLVCAVLLKSQGLIDDILFVHPKDVQDGKVKIGAGDITANVPYAPSCHLAFDHHASETTRIGAPAPRNLVLDPKAPSAARVIYDHFGGQAGFPAFSRELLAAADKADTAQFTRDEVLDPKGWVLLSFLMDPRTGLGRFKDFEVSNYKLMMEVFESSRQDSTVDEILRLPHMAERVALYRSHQVPFREQLHRCARVHANLVVIDLRNEETIFAGNRFVIYALFPQCTVSMHVMWGVKREVTVFAMGKSIFNRTSRTDIGRLALSYGGGGHAAAGTCQVANSRAEAVLAELIERITTDG
jgi:nanoRNase/pAp phosphatase (c-di-AMP/oligoRNAs hydrolase)